MPAAAWYIKHSRVSAPYGREEPGPSLRYERRELLLFNHKTKLIKTCLAEFHTSRRRRLTFIHHRCSSERKLSEERGTSDEGNLTEASAGGGKGVRGNR